MTIRWLVAVCAFVLLCGTPLAWVIARRRNRLWRVLETVIELPVVLPPVS